MVIRKHITVLSYSLFVLAQVLFAIAVIADQRKLKPQSAIGNLTMALGLERLIRPATAHRCPGQWGWWVNGEAGNAVSANAGHRQYVSIPAIDLSDTQAVTVAFWTNRNYTTDGGSVLLEDSSNYQDSTTGFCSFA